MDLPSNYNEDGTPTVANTQRKMDERKEYLKAVLDAEDSGKLSPILSSALRPKNPGCCSSNAVILCEGNGPLYRIAKTNIIRSIKHRETKFQTEGTDLLACAVLDNPHHPSSEIKPSL
jgi:hypothetical protein